MSTTRTTEQSPSSHKRRMFSSPVLNMSLSCAPGSEEAARGVSRDMLTSKPHKHFVTPERRGGSGASPAPLVTAITSSEHQIIIAGIACLLGLCLLCSRLRSVKLVEEQKLLLTNHQYKPIVTPHRLTTLARLSFAPRNHGFIVTFRFRGRVSVRRHVEE